MKGKDGGAVKVQDADDSTTFLVDERACLPFPQQASAIPKGARVLALWPIAGTGKTASLEKFTTIFYPVTTREESNGREAVPLVEKEKKKNISICRKFILYFDNDKIYG